MVHIAITRRVKPGMEIPFENSLRDFVRESLHEPGTTGVHLVSPAPDAVDREFGILRSFENEAARQAFYASEVYAKWKEQVAPLVVGAPVSRRLHGLEAFFREGALAPPRWKMAFVTWIGVCAAVLLWSSVLPKALAGLHPLLIMGIVNAFVVASLAWVLMPMLTKLLASWLHRQTNRGNRN